jgi:hypothetical protein
MVTEGFAGATDIESRVGGCRITVKVVEPLTEPKVAVIAVGPAVSAEANPAETPATTGLEELQVTAPVRSCVLLSP